MSFRFLFLYALFIMLLVAMNLLGLKTTTLFGISVSVGFFLVPFSFLIMDVISEVYGKKISKWCMWSGMGILILLFLCTTFFVFVDPSARFAPQNEAYTSIFSSSLRMMIASVLAFVLSSFQDIWTFFGLRKRTGAKHFWLRINVSSYISEAIDTLIFMFVAFLWTTPQYTPEFVLGLAIPYYLFKISFSTLSTPLAYALKEWLQSEKIET